MTHHSDDEEARHHDGDQLGYPTRWHKLTWWGPVIILASQLVTLANTLIQLIGR